LEDNNKKICPICGEAMKEYEYAYDNNQYGKIYYKCPECGHKENTINN
jgi:C4-type Zn-finger protein